MIDIVTCDEAPSTAQLLEMVQKLTGRLEKLEEKGNLTDEVGKLGEVMTGAMEKLGDKTEKLGEAMTGTVKSLGESLENIHLLTTARNQTLRVDLEDFANNTAYAKYRFLAIDGPDSFYRLHVGGYSGTAGDSLAYHNGQPFTTLDSDHDPDPTTECAVYNHGAWWYNRCHYSNLNGPYLTFAQKTYKSISWKHWKNSFIALKHVEMKIRPAL
nr:hypothetical protein BaRGS_026244 [Batillaria attramentaria]